MLDSPGAAPAFATTATSNKLVLPAETTNPVAASGLIVAFPPALSNVQVIPE
jgi:hypothetical protein